MSLSINTYFLCKNVYVIIESHFDVDKIILIKEYT